MYRLNPVSMLMESGIREKVFPGGVILCARGRKVLYHEAFGLADLQTRRPMVKHAVFDLASLTKPLVTATLTCLLIQEGGIFPTTRIQEIIPETRSTPKADITVDMLLRHTSGLPPHREYHRFILQVAKNTCIHPRQVLRDLILAEPLESRPGEKQVYSDLGYMVLAWMVETLLSKRIDRAAQERIFEPLGIENLFYINLAQDPLSRRNGRKIGQMIPWVSNQVCPWREKTMTGQVDDENAWAAGGIEGHAGLFGDAVSVHRFCCEILNALQNKSCTILDPRVFEKLVKKYPGQDMVAGFDTPTRIGSSAGKYFSPASVGHLGFTGTSFWIDPEFEFIIILLTNRTLPTRANQQIKNFRPRIHDILVSYFR